MYFELINKRFWRDNVLSEIDPYTLLSLVKTCKYFYNRRKYYYCIVFQHILMQYTSRHFTPNKVLICEDIFKKNKYICGMMQEHYRKLKLKEKKYYQHMVGSLQERLPPLIRGEDVPLDDEFCRIHINY